MASGLIHVYFGEGKGKTTAAAGLALRAAGCGKDVIFAQFMKGNDSGEIAAMKQISGIRVFRNQENYGFYNQMGEQDKAQITREHDDTLRKIMQIIVHGDCDMLILDEITYPYNWNLIDKEAVERLIAQKPSSLELVITGREPDEMFLQKADYITEMKCIKHPYEVGIAARRGIEY